MARVYDTSIIVLSYLFGDNKGTESVRTTRISESFQKFFKGVNVICNHGLENDSKAHIYNVEVSSLKESLKKSKDGKLLNEESKTRLWFKLAEKAIKSFPSNLLLADTNFFYIHKAIQIAEDIIKKEDVTHIYSSIPPYGDHYIAYILKKRHPHIKWIADFRDLHVEPLYKDVYLPDFQERIESKILKKADLVTTVSEGLVKHLNKFQRPTISVMRGMEQRSEKKKYDKFTISYTGSLFQTHRDPRPLFKCIKEFIARNEIDKKDLKILYAGKDQDLFSKWIMDYDLKDIYESRGLITRKEAHEIQDRSHINLLLTSSTPEWQGVLTGKIFEYIESGTPILCLVKGVKDKELEGIIAEFNAGQVAYEPELSPGLLTAFFLSKYQEWNSGSYSNNFVNGKAPLDAHSWDQRATFMLEKLEENS